MKVSFGILVITRLYEPMCMQSYGGITSELCAPIMLHDHMNESMHSKERQNQLIRMK